MFPHVDGEVLNDEVVIIHSSGSAGEPKVLEPYTRVRLPSVSGDVGRVAESAVGTTLSRCDNQRPVALGHPGWGSGRLVSHHAWDACPHTPRWSGQGLYRLLSPPLDRRPHRVGHGVDC